MALTRACGEHNSSVIITIMMAVMIAVGEPMVASSLLWNGSQQGGGIPDRRAKNLMEMTRMSAEPLPMQCLKHSP